MKVIRFIAVLPTAFFMFILVNVLFKIVHSLLIGIVDIDGLWYQIAVSSSSIYVFLYFGLKVAPSHKKMVLIILTSIVTAMFLFVLYSTVVWFDGWQDIIITVASLFTIGVTYQILTDEVE